MTVDEVVEYLKRSTLPTVLVEGKDDARIYRALDSSLKATGADLLQCGGRSTLLGVFGRRNEFRHLKAAFLADRDMWLFSAIPAEYGSIVFTEGYCLENDIYAPSTIEDLLYEEEKQPHKNLIAVISKWFAFEISEFRAGREAQVGARLGHVVPPGTDSISPAFIAARGFVEPDATLVAEITRDYRLKVRGKNLFQVLTRFLDKPGRGARMNTMAQIDIALNDCKRLGSLDRITNELAAALQ